LVIVLMLISWRIGDSRTCAMQYGIWYATLQRKIAPEQPCFAGITVAGPTLDGRSEIAAERDTCC